MTDFSRTDLVLLRDEDLDSNLVSDITGEPGYEFYSAAEFDGAYRTGGEIQVAYSADAGRAGLVYVGSGSSGHTFWTDCSSAEDALRRFLDDALSP